MKPVRILQITSSAVLLVCGQAYAQDEAVKISTKASYSIVYIKIAGIVASNGSIEEKIGTGFVITENGHIITAAHNLSDAKGADYKSVTITGRLGGKYKGTEIPLFVIEQKKNLDVALLRFPDTGSKFVAADVCLSGDPIVGSKWYAFGFPHDSDFTPLEGNFANVNVSGGRWQASIPLSFGMSGGPIYNKDGYVIGIAKGGLDGTEAVRYVTPINFAKDLLDIASAGKVVKSCNNVAAKPIEQPEKDVGAVVNIIPPDRAIPILPAEEPIGTITRRSNSNSQTNYQPQQAASQPPRELREGRDSKGRLCREYVQEVHVMGRVQYGFGTACQRPDGTWEVLN